MFKTRAFGLASCAAANKNPRPMPAALAFILGIFSMGFQLLGSRMLQPWFGSSIIVWAFIISAFLAAFSVGSMLGGLLVRQTGMKRHRLLMLVSGVAVAGFVVNAALARGLLGWLDRMAGSQEMALTIACIILFFPPVCSLSILTPVLIQRLHESGQKAGFASGLVYCTSTLGNIAGIMLTAFVFIPRASVSSLLWLWTGGVALVLIILLRCVRN